MQRIPIQSSNLRSIGYDPRTYTLEVEFLNGGLYQYSGVPPHIHAALMSARSHGSYFSHVIKTGYPCHKLS
ncbi:KTSC domain-containing protein [Deinococcus sp. UYEF24]